MYEDTEGNIYGELNYLPISLFSNKIRIGIIGGGRAALIKARGLYEKGCIVEVMSVEFLDEFNNYSNDRMILTKGYYNKSFIINKHIIIIAINDNETIKDIIEDCNENCKIFINSTNFKEGLGAISVTRETESLSISVNTKEGNPKAAVLAADYAKEVLEELDPYIKFTSKVRNNIININKDLKRCILDFISSEDYRYFYNKHKGDLVLKMFFEEVEKIINFNKSED